MREGGTGKERIREEGRNAREREGQGRREE